MKITRHRLNADQAESIEEVFFSANHKKLGDYLRGLYGGSRVTRFDSRSATFFNEEGTEWYILTKTEKNKEVPVTHTISKRIGFTMNLLDVAEEEEFATTSL